MPVEASSHDFLVDRVAERGAELDVADDRGRRVQQLVKERRDSRLWRENPPGRRLPLDLQRIGRRDRLRATERHGMSPESSAATSACAPPTKRISISSTFGRPRA